MKRTKVLQWVVGLSFIGFVGIMSYHRPNKQTKSNLTDIKATTDTIESKIFNVIDDVQSFVNKKEKEADSLKHQQPVIEYKYITKKVVLDPTDIPEIKDTLKLDPYILQDTIRDTIIIRDTLRLMPVYLRDTIFYKDTMLIPVSN